MSLSFLSIGTTSNVTSSQTPAQISQPIITTFHLFPLIVHSFIFFMAVWLPLSTFFIYLIVDIHLPGIQQSLLYPQNLEQKVVVQVLKGEVRKAGGGLSSAFTNGESDQAFHTSQIN